MIRIGSATKKSTTHARTLESGMIPKVRSSADALEAGVERVHFLNGTYPHSILVEIFTDAGIGTMFKQND